MLYDDMGAMLAEYGDRLRAADSVMVGSYVPDGIALIDRLAGMGLRQLTFYDIDTPVTMQALDDGTCEYLAPRQIPLFDIYFSFSGGEVLTHLRDVRGARRAEALYCSVDDALYPALDLPKRWDFGYLGTYSPTASRRWMRCCWNPRGCCPTCASSWPGRNTRTTSIGPPTWTGSSICPRRPSRLLQRAALHPERDAGGDAPHGLVPQRPPVRGRVLRRAGHQR
ncbi:hypothetical protein ACFSYD_22825 [Paracoccus aerius]